MLFLEKIDYSEKGFHFVLGYLANAKEEVIAGDLAKKLNVSTARIAVLLKKMESKGVIKKFNSNMDSRKTVVVLTDKGKIIVDEFKETMISTMMEIIHDVGFDEIENFVRISKKIKKSIEGKNSYICKNKSIDKF